MMNNNVLRPNPDWQNNNKNNIDPETKQSLPELPKAAVGSPSSKDKPYFPRRSSLTFAEPDGSKVNPHIPVVDCDGSDDSLDVEVSGGCPFKPAANNNNSNMATPRRSSVGILGSSTTHSNTMAEGTIEKQETPEQVFTKLLEQTANGVFSKLRKDCEGIEVELDVSDKDVLQKEAVTFVQRENEMEMSALISTQTQEYNFRKNVLEKELVARQERKKAKLQQRNSMRGIKRRDVQIQAQEVNANAVHKLKEGLVQRRSHFDRSMAAMAEMHERQRRNILNSQARQLAAEKSLNDFSSRHLNEELRATVLKKFQSKTGHIIAVNKKIVEHLRELQQVEIKHAKERFDVELSGFEEVENLKIKQMGFIMETKARHLSQLYDEKEAERSKHESDKLHQLKKKHSLELKRLAKEQRHAIRELKALHSQRLSSAASKCIGSRLNSGLSSKLGSNQGSRKHSVSSSASSISPTSGTGNTIREESTPIKGNSHMLQSELLEEAHENQEDEEKDNEEAINLSRTGIQLLQRRQNEEINNMYSLHKAEVNNMIMATSAKLQDMEERHENEINNLLVAQAQDLSNLKALQEKEYMMEEHLHDSEMKALVERRVLNSVLGTVVDGIINIDPKGTLMRFNRAAESMFGYKAEEVIGKNIKMLMPERYSKNHDQYLLNYLTTGIKKVIGSGRRIHGLKKDGTEFPLQLSVSELKDDGEHLFTGIARDLTEQVRLEEENRKRDEEKQVQLEKMVADLDVAKRRSENLIKQMLPESVSQSLMEGKEVKPQMFQQATVFYSDIVQFTTICSKIRPIDTVALLGELYNTFDSVIEKYDAFKVETIGDCYVVCSGVPQPNGKRHAGEIATMALDILSKVRHFVSPVNLGDQKIQVRIGIHTGPVMAGVVGTKMPRYCLFGDTCHIANRVESTGQPMRIQVTETTFQLLNEIGGYHLIEREEGISLKGQEDAKMKTYWLTGKAARRQSTILDPVSESGGASS